MNAQPSPKPVPLLAEGWADNVPGAIKDRPQWVVWRYQLDKDRRDWTKVPFRADDPESHASTTDARTWGTFADAKAMFDRRSPRMDAGKLDGVGFVFSPGDPFVGVDLDRCLNEDGAARDWAKKYLGPLRTYAEISPGGLGVKLIAEGALDGPGHKRTVEGGAVEMYDRGRFFTITGRSFEGHPAEVADLTSAVAKMYRKLWPPGPPGKESVKLVRETVELTDEEILAKAFASKAGAKVKSLYDGDTSAHGGDDSSADMALCNHLAFWFGKDPAAVDRVFRTSGLMRAKWDDPRGATTYGADTVAKAVDWTANHYSPQVEVSIVVKGRKVALGTAAPEGAAPAPAETFDDPFRLARGFAENRIYDDFRTLWHWRDEWHGWDGQRYAPVSDTEVKAALTTHCKAEFDLAARATDKPAAKITRTLVNNVVGCLQAISILPARAYPSRPAWIDPDTEGVPSPSEVIPAKNSLLHLPAFVEGRQYDLAPTPRFFSPNCLDYAFEPDAPRPNHWLDFLDSIWPDDPASVDCLQEWFGYLLTPDTRQQKMLAVIGPPRSGKGTIARVLTALVGRDNVASPTLSSMATNFGTAPLIGKTVAIFPDARLSGRQDGQVVVERLLSITGEDDQTIDRKHLPSWEGRLISRFVLLSNEVPRLGDSSGAITSRLVILRLDNSFVGKEDHGIADRIMSELPSVLLWAVAGWARLQKRGRFVQPETGLELVGELAELSSPIASFVAERCEVGPDKSVTIPALYREWLAWCQEQGKDHPGDQIGFGKNLRAAVPSVRRERVSEGGKRPWAYEGIGLSLF